MIYKIKHKKLKENERKDEYFFSFLSFLGFLLIIAFTYYSDSQWCYLALIIITAVCTKLIDKELIETAIRAFSPNPYKEKSKQEIDEKHREENSDFREDNSEENSFETVNSDNSADDEKNKHENKNEADAGFKGDDLSNNSDKDNAEESNEEQSSNTENTDKPIYVRPYKERLEHSLLNEKKVVEWFLNYAGINFDRNISVSYKDYGRIVPDGIYRTKYRDYILEVKSCFNNISYVNCIKNCYSQIQKDKQFYLQYNKPAEFCMAVVIENADSLKLEKLDTYIKTKFQNYIASDLQIFIFCLENNQLLLMHHYRY